MPRRARLGDVPVENVNAALEWRASEGRRSRTSARQRIVEAIDGDPSAAVDLLERQACNCVGRVQCLRCELLELLGVDPAESR